MSRNDDTTIRFSGLKPGVYEYGFTLGRAFFERFKNDEIVDGEVQISAHMERLEHTLMFSFSVDGKVTVECDRCLAPMEVPITGTESLCVRFSDTETTDDEDVVVLPEHAYELDLSQWLYEYVAVRIPMQHMHPEGECDPAVAAYLSAEATADGNDGIDPRWEALAKLK